METVPNQVSFNLQEGEEVKYTNPNITVTIKGDKDEVVLTHGSLSLTTQRVVYTQFLPRKVCLFFRYQNCITHGIDKQNLICNVSDLQEPIEEEEEEDEENVMEKEPDFILEKIRTVDSDSFEDWVQLAGNYQVIFHYGDHGQDHLKNVFSVFSECSALNPDDDVHPDQDNIQFNEFITAQDIDEHGNVRNFEEEGEFLEESGGYEDEDDDDEIKEIYRNGAMGTKKHQKDGAGDPMEME